MNALAQLGMVSEIPSENQTTIATFPSFEDEDRKDYFVEKEGMKFAGTHLLVDLWGATNLDNPELIDAALRGAAIRAGATILHSHFHHFSPNGGVSGVVVLAESHISIHTWPEHGFAAIDAFMCGTGTTHAARAVFEQALAPQRVDVRVARRGAEPASN